MKKFLSATVFAICILFSNFVSANEVEKAMAYYDKNPDYAYVATRHVGSFYLYLPSIEVQEYNPPHYQIAGHFVFVSGWTGEVKDHFIAVRYNFFTKETFHRNEKRNNGWKKSAVEGDSGVARDNRHYADALFHAAYGMFFYGY